MKPVLYTEARDLLLELAVPVNTEYLPLTECYGRILAEDLIAAENIEPLLLPVDSLFADKPAYTVTEKAVRLNQQKQPKHVCYGNGKHYQFRQSVENRERNQLQTYS